MSTTSPRRVDGNIEQGTPLSLQQQITALEQQILEFKNSTAGEAERARAIDGCLAGIARVSNAIKDASPFLAAYDQRNYSNSIKTLSERLQEARSSFAPKRKFAFKNKQQAAPSDSKEQDFRPDIGNSLPAVTDKVITRNDTSNQLTAESDGVNAQGQSPEKLQGSILSKPAIPSSDGTFTITDRCSEYIKEGKTAALPTGPLSASITTIKNCIINIAPPKNTQSPPFAKIHIYGGHQSLFICGSVRGSAFLSNCAKCIIVTTCGQLRLHNSTDCVVYLHCASKPVIEGCTRTKFAPLPGPFVVNNVQSQNLWNQVEDFMWLRPEPSPNWRVLTDEETISDELWQQAANGTHGIEILGDVLKVTQA